MATEHIVTNHVFLESAKAVLSDQSFALSIWYVFFFAKNRKVKNAVMHLPMYILASES